jgi:integrase
MSRRTYGTGSLRVVERAGSRQAWEAAWRPAPGARVVTRSLGLVRRRGEADGLTRAMAEKALREAIAKLAEQRAAKGPTPPSRGLTVEDVCRRYLTSRQAMGRKPTTLRGIESAHRLWIIPALGHRRLADVARHDFDALTASIAAAGRKPRYVRNVAAEFASLMNWCVREGLLDRSPADLSRLPQVRAEARIRFLTVPEVDALVRCVPDSDRRVLWQALFRVAAGTGLRKGELRALRWDDVDFAGEALRVLNNVERHFDPTRTPDRGRPAPRTRRTATGTTKTRAGERAVPMAEEVLVALDRLHQEQGSPPGTALVFPSPRDGGPLGESTMDRALRDALAEAGLPHRTMHELRHSFGTAMAAAGVPVRTLQAWMGHERIQSTEVYMHYAPRHDEARQATEAFRKLRDLAPAAAVTDDPSIHPSI